MFFSGLFHFELNLFFSSKTIDFPILDADNKRPLTKRPMATFQHHKSRWNRPWGFSIEDLKSWSNPPNILSPFHLQTDENPIDFLQN
jgi:hypothetical protein